MRKFNFLFLAIFATSLFLMSCSNEDIKPEVDPSVVVSPNASAGGADCMISVDKTVDNAEIQAEVSWFYASNDAQSPKLVTKEVDERPIKLDKWQNPDFMPISKAYQENGYKKGVYYCQIRLIVDDIKDTNPDNNVSSAKLYVQ